jgi:hypothetical protein
MTTAQIAAITMVAKGYPADDEALKAVAVEMVVTVLISARGYLNGVIVQRMESNRPHLDMA